MNVLRRLMLVILLIPSLGALGACTAGQSVSTPMQPSELLERLQSDTPGLILDVRSREEFAQGHIPGAVNIPHTELGARLSELKAATSDPVIVYCEAGGRAGQAEALLQQAGYTRLFDLVGHMGAWRSSGQPVEK